MNLQSLVVVLLRLLTLDFLLRIALQIVPQVFQPYIDSTLVLLLLAGAIAAAILLWVKALPIARFVTRGVPHDLSFGTMALVDCYSIAFIAIGLFYGVSHLPQVLNWTHFFLKSAASASSTIGQEYSGYDVSQAFIPFIVGIILFVKGRSWAATLARRHNTDTHPNRASDATREG